jgi:hypothetical protein
MLLTGVELGEDGALVVKRTSGTDRVEALRREAERLRRAEHPGVVSMVRSGPTRDGWELVLAHAGRPLSTALPLAPRTAAGIAAAVASTVADLHDLGVVHGRLDASHVLLGPQGRPVLCGLGDGTAAATRADDVAAIGQLITEMLGSGTEVEPVPDRRWLPLRPRPAWERKALLAVSDLALAEPPERRPTARRLAGALVDAVPVLEPPADRARGDERDRSERPRPAHAAAPRRGTGLVTAALAVAALLAGVMIVVGVAGWRERASGVVGTAAPTAPVTATAGPVDGSVLSLDGRRYRVGEPGDHLLVDDWHCDGEPTPAVLRPSTHELFVFDRWADEEPVSVPPIATIDGATALVAQEGADGCPVLAAVVDGERLVPIDLGGAP